MDQTAQALQVAHLIYSRANSTSSTTNANTATRPPIYKAIGISLAIASGVFIGVSFVLKKVGLLKANEKYNEEAGEGYAYLKNAYWWSGMTLMIIGEICNFVAYAFVDAILVTPLGALSVVITTILSAIFLKERLSMVGKVGCFLCIIGSVVIVMNAPAESSAATIQEMQHFVIAPGFLSYAGVIILGSAFTALWVGPRYGKKSMLVYLSICSFIGGLSVVATQGLGAAIVAQAGGTKQYNQWFLYVLFVFVVLTLLTEIVYLNKALNLFNAALVTPTYYVIFTSATIITSAILFQGFKGTVTSIVTCVMGFFVICAGVVLLQLSKSAKDVPDTAVFAGDLDQMRTIAEQEQPESEPKADAIRGAGLGTIVRRFSVTRQKMEEEELRRLHEEKQAMETIGENEDVQWDGLRRRRTTYGTTRSRGSSNLPFPPMESHTAPLPQSPRAHPPLGMSHFPRDSDEEEEMQRPHTGTSGFNSFFGSLRDRTRSVIVPGSPRHDTRSPMHPVPLTEIAIPKADGGAQYYNHPDYDAAEHRFGLPDSLQKTSYEGAAGAHDRHITIVDADVDSQRTGSRGSTSEPPPPPPHTARRQFSFQNVFKKGQAQAQVAHDNEPMPSPARSTHARLGLGSRSNSKAAASGATEEERLGLVKGDSHSMPSLPQYDEEDESDEWTGVDNTARPRGERSNTAPQPVHMRANNRDVETDDDRDSYEEQRQRWNDSIGDAFASPKPGPGRPGAFL
ncbi:DUF803-domain-containing protein [Coleophoma cylindrospora]|uniref:DUF803-domain-containing protein n=1 Tax=Coleophoma cylindrospora TaxID=1849047 RepID=A0A3D8RZQ0_9HELO|nr:DUF803-domain-containing protein [Coleophoma cylindrospora]